MPRRWLDGLRVGEVGPHLGVRYAGWILASEGATVMRLEVGPPPGADPSAIYDVHKRVDRCPPGDESTRVQDLLSAVDVALIGYEVRDLERLDILPASLQDAHPGLRAIYLTPYGLTGPQASWKATPLTLHAEGGWMSAMGEPDREPVQPGAPSGYLITGLYAAIAAVATTDGLSAGGMILDISTLEAIVATMNYDTVVFSYTGETRHRGGKLFHAPNPLHITLPALDGYVCIHVGFEHQWPRLCEMFGHPELASDSRYNSHRARLEHSPEVVDLVEGWVREWDRDAVYHEGQRRRIPTCKVHTLPDLIDWPHLRERGFWETVEYSGGTVGAPSYLSRVSEVSATNTSATPNGAVLPTGQKLRVLELAMVWSGPFCAQVLADLGAEVIKIESPSRLDPRRNSLKQQSTKDFESDQPWELSPSFAANNAGKRGLMIELGDPRGRDLFLQLVDQSDVVIENFRPGAMTKMGLGPEALLARNSRLIYCSMPFLGTAGPEASYGGFGMTAEALSGLASLAGYQDGPPQLQANALADPVTGLASAIGILVALHQRQRSGRGAIVEASHVEPIISFIAPQIAQYQLTGEEAARIGNSHPTMAPHGVYPTDRPDCWLALAVANDEQWQRLAELITLAGGTTSEAWSAAPARKWDQARVDAAVSTWSGSLDVVDAVSLLQRIGIAAARVAAEPDVLGNEQLLQRGFMQMITRDHVGTHPYPGPVIGSGAAADGLRSPAPTIGQHNRDILGEILGLSVEAVKVLEAQGVVTIRPLVAPG
ncbi:MAG: CoA transferase [Dehalococcoidia bacterium]